MGKAATPASESQKRRQAKSGLAKHPPVHVRSGLGGSLIEDFGKLTGEHKH